MTAVPWRVTGAHPPASSRGPGRWSDPLRRVSLLALSTFTSLMPQPRMVGSWRGWRGARSPKRSELQVSEESPSESVGTPMVRSVKGQQAESLPLATPRHGSLAPGPPRSQVRRSLEGLRGNPAAEGTMGCRDGVSWCGLRSRPRSLRVANTDECVSHHGGGSSRGAHVTLGSRRQAPCERRACLWTGGWDEGPDRAWFG